ncbi:MAG: gamma-glutamylcyclotransferase [Abditibacteriota bacterium]|nr:gamma-glutamylcyclotransferase [Abditibacteriota bacterium]
MSSRPYIAYGSNLNKSQMQYRCHGARPLGTAQLNDHELVFRRGYLTVEPRQDAYVPVAVWLTSDTDEKSLDMYEGFPRFYVKKDFLLQVTLPDGASEERLCYCYIMREGYPLKAPTQQYINTCRKGYLDFGLDVRVLEKAYEDSLRR